MSDEAALLKDIEAQPEEDVPRLMLADWYAEQGCPDKECDQRLAVQMRQVVAHKRDDEPRLEYAAILERFGRWERAELIRVQCRVARLPPFVRTAFGVATPGHEHPIPAKSFARRSAINEAKVLLQRQNELLSLFWREPYFHTPGLWIASDPAQWDRGFVRTVRQIGRAWIDFGDEICRAVPVEQVILATRPELIQHRNGYELEGDPRRMVFKPWGLRMELGADDEDLVLAALKLRWPGVDFEIPSE